MADRGAGGRATSKMTPERVDAVILGLRKGLPRTVAAEAAGISKDTLRRWAQRQPAFAARLREAEAQAQSMLMGFMLEVVASRQPHTWQAIAWLLERRWPELYGQRAKLDVSLDVRTEVARVAAQAGVDPAVLLTMAEAILEGSAPLPPDAADAPR